MKEILIAIISFTASAIIISLGMTVVGNFIAPDTVNIAASYDATSPKAVPENQQANTKESVSIEKEEIISDTEKEESPERLIAVTDTKLPVSKEKNVVEHALSDKTSEVSETSEIIQTEKRLVASETIPGQEALEKMIQPDTSVLEETETQETETPEAELPETATEESVVEEETVSEKTTEEMDAGAIEEEILEETVTPVPEIISETAEEEMLEETVTPEPEIIPEELPVEEPKEEAVSEVIPSEKESDPALKEESKADEEMPVPEKQESADIQEEISEEEEVKKGEDVKPKTAEEIKKLTASLKNGEKIDLGDGRIAYKVKSGDTFSQICQKVIGTSSTWRDEVKKMGIDYRKIYPGMVLFFKK